MAPPPASLHTRRWVVALALLAAAAGPGAAATAAGQPGQPRRIVYGAGSWGTLANFFFLLSALFADILHVRVMLVLAYLCLIMQVALGFPGPLLWTVNRSFSDFQLGNVLWFGITLALQLYGLAVLLLDEAPVRLRGDDEMLWRLFYRRCGITRREFSHVLKLGRWRRYQAGELIEHRDKDEPRVAVIFSGAVELRDSSHRLPPVGLASGQLLNLHLCNLFGVYIGFEADPDERDLMVAASDVALFGWDLAALLRMASGAASVAVPAYFRSFLLNVVALHYHRQQLGTPPYTSFGEPEPDPQAWAEGRALTVDLTDPLRPEERDKATCMSVLRFIFGPLSVKVPRGIRHHANPKSGAMATARVLLAAQMRQRNQALPAALSNNLDALLPKADQAVVQHYSACLDAIREASSRRCSASAAGRCGASAADGAGTVQGGACARGGGQQRPAAAAAGLEMAHAGAGVREQRSGIEPWQGAAAAAGSCGDRGGSSADIEQGASQRAAGPAVSPFAHAAGNGRGPRLDAGDVKQ